MEQNPLSAQQLVSLLAILPQVDRGRTSELSCARKLFGFDRQTKEGNTNPYLWSMLTGCLTAERQRFAILLSSHNQVKA